jgi:hypothetical protein
MTASTGHAAALSQMGAKRGSGPARWNVRRHRAAALATGPAAFYVSSHETWERTCRLHIGSSEIAASRSTGSNWLNLGRNGRLRFRSMIKTFGRWRSTHP